MKSISTKLFLALLGLTSLVLIATLLLARWSFDQGFLDYLNSQQERRLTNMATDLSEHYSDNGDKWTDQTSKVYRQTHRKWFPGPEGRSSPRARSRVSDGDSRLSITNDSDSPSGLELPPPPRRGKFKKGLAPHARFFHEPVVLFNVQGDPIAGRHNLLKDEKLISVDIISNEKVVGTVQAIKRVKLSSGFESSFSKQQTNASFIIVVVSLVIAGIASWALSRMLLAPTYKMKNSIASLVKGDFSNRLTVMNDDELGQLMRDINRLSETLEENRTSRRRWLADISHELRTPVAILSGELEAVIDGIRPLNTQTIESLGHEVDRLKHLIDDLYQLSLSDIGGLRYQFTSTNIAELLELVVAQQTSMLENGGMTLNVNIEAGVFIDADVARLEQLFTNLINNSIAYTDAPGQIEICLKQENGFALIKFNDSAPGIEASSIHQVFEPLFREDASRNRRVGGAGLGLSISKNIVHGHQGSISVMPSSLGGLEFIIRLPINRKT